MTAAIRAEFRKFFTTRLWWGMAIAMLRQRRRLRRPLRLRLHERRRAGPAGRGRAEHRRRRSPRRSSPAASRSATC